jgi:hypothetical protein
MIVCHQRAFEIPIYWSREVRKRGVVAVVMLLTVLEMVAMMGKPDDGEAFERGYIMDTL